MKSLITICKGNLLSSIVFLYHHEEFTKYFRQITPINFINYEEIFIFRKLENIVSKEDNINFNNIKNASKGKIIEKKIPTDAEIENIKNNRVLDDVKKSIKTENLDEYLKVIKNNSSADISSEEIAAGLLKKIRNE